MRSYEYCRAGARGFATRCCAPELDEGHWQGAVSGQDGARLLAELARDSGGVTCLNRLLNGQSIVKVSSGGIGSAS
jgi:hypothetical protein